MKKVVSLFACFVLLIMSSFIFCNSMSWANDDGIMPLATQVIIYQYMEGNTFRTPTYTNRGESAYTIIGKVSGSNLKVSLMNATTGKQVGETKTMKTGEQNIITWPNNSIPMGEDFYYLFKKTSILPGSVFLNFYYLH